MYYVFYLRVRKKSLMRDNIIDYYRHSTTLQELSVL